MKSRISTSCFKIYWWSSIMVHTASAWLMRISVTLRTLGPYQVSSLLECLQNTSILEEECEHFNILSPLNHAFLRYFHPTSPRFAERRMKVRFLVHRCRIPKSSHRILKCDQSNPIRFENSSSGSSKNCIRS